MHIEIMHDPDPPNPRKEWDNLGTMVCGHRKYRLGDEAPRQADIFDSWEQLMQDYEKGEGAEFMLPLYLYDHSGITMSTTPFSCRWDSGQVGLIYVTRAKVLEYFRWKYITKKRRERVLEALRAEVKEYDYYLTGQVYGYVIVNDAGEETDSCWGFFGPPSESGMKDHVPEELHDKVMKNEITY